MFIPWPYSDGDFFRRPPNARRPPDAATTDGEGEHIAGVITARLRADPRTAAEEIAVSVQNRVVILAGFVGSPEVAHVAGEHAWQTADVFDVCNALTWPSQHW